MKTPQEKIAEAVGLARAYPRSTVEYYFEEPIEEEWFGGIPHSENKEMEINSAKMIWKMG